MSVPNTTFLDEAATVEKTLQAGAAAGDLVLLAILFAMDIAAVGGDWTYQFKSGTTLLGAARTITAGNSVVIKAGEQWIQANPNEDFVLVLTRTGGTLVGHATGRLVNKTKIGG